MRKPYRILLHAPDRHIVYDGRMPDEIGVGGGITARVRMAAALARLGHNVTVHANCKKRSIIDQVEYLPLDMVPPSIVDVLIINATGGSLELKSAADLPTEARLRIVWIGGKPKPQNLGATRYDYLYTVSNFLRDVVVQEWSTPQSSVFVAYNGVTEQLYGDRLDASDPRDPYRLAYSGHPEKGLDTAREILARLRQVDQRYTLHVYGDESLWGQAAGPPRDEPGLTYHGVIGQRALAKELAKASVALHLQSMEEAYGISVAESMRAGCIVVASPVGAIPELIRDTENGFLVSGSHTSEETRERAASLIQRLTEHPDFASYIRGNAIGLIWTWDRMARVWTGHWDWIFGNGQHGERISLPQELFRCRFCKGKILLLADGYHCTRCGRYLRRLDKEDQIREKHAWQEDNSNRSTIVSELDARERQIEAQTQELAAIEGSLTWSFVKRLRRLINSIAPGGSRRGNTMEAGKATFSKTLALGPTGILRRITPKPAHQIARRTWETIRVLRMRDSVARWSGEITNITESMQDARDIIIFPPSLDWQIQLFQRPQQLARSLARTGALVFYMEPSTSSRASGIHREEDRLYLCKLPARVFSVLPDAAFYTLTWNRGQLVNFKFARLIYDFVDDLQVFHTDDPEHLKKEHIELLRRATLVITTAQILHEQVLPERPDALLCPNGVDYGHFARASEEGADAVPDDIMPLINKGAPIVGYYGALAHWFDYGLLGAVAAARQDLSFVLIGPDYDGSLKKSAVRHLQNVHWLGPKSYGELPKYLRHFAVGIIPFKLNRITHATSPLKLFEYMAAGKPVVATPMMESMRYPGVIAAEGRNDFSDALDRALDEGKDPDYLSLIDRVARENTWEIRAEAILGALSSKAAQ